MDIAQPAGGRGGAFEKGEGGVEGDVRHRCRRNLITSSSERSKIFFVCSEKFLFLSITLIGRRIKGCLLKIL